jgi:hypothetical protein
VKNNIEQILLKLQNENTSENNSFFFIFECKVNKKRRRGVDETPLLRYPLFFGKKIKNIKIILKM